MKKVLFMAKALGGGGAEIAMIELINKMDESEYDITLALLDEDIEFESRLKRKVKIEQIKFNSNFSRNMVSMYSTIAKILKKLSINRILPYYNALFASVVNQFEDEYDLAFDFYGYGYFLTGYMAEKIKAKKKATWLHDENMYWFKSVQRYAGKFDKIFAVSQAVKDSFCTQFTSLSNKCEVFYNVIDIDLILQKAKMSCGYKLDGEFVILTVGRLHKQKGYDVAIKAAEKLKERNVMFKWYVIGTGRGKRKFEKMIHKLKLEDCFILLGQKENPYTYMKQCDLYVQPSRHEGYVITLVEARALALPIVTSDIPSAHEQIIDGVNGFIVSLNSNSIANKIEELIRQPEAMNEVKRYLQGHKLDYSSELVKIEMGKS